jgi:hypothetical protein
MVKRHVYRQSHAATQATSCSLASSYGSGISPAASRSVCTHPGTVAGISASTIAAGAAPAGLLQVSTQPSWSDRSARGRAGDVVGVLTVG